MKLDPPEPLDGDDNKCKNSQIFERSVNALQTCLTFKDIDLNERSALGLVEFKVTNCALVRYNQFLQELQEKDHSFFKFILALRTFLILSISKDLLWNA